MVNQRKIFETEDLRARINNSKGFFLVGYQGWGANLFNQLRQRVSQEGGELKVIRNRLFARAIEGFVDVNEPITGPTACLFSLTDKVAPLSAFYNFLKENDLEPDFKLGFFTNEKQTLDKQETFRLANLPSVGDLKAMLVTSLAANLGCLLNVLDAPLQKLVLVIKSLESKGGGEK
jgi:ribosomal protein L10